MLEEATASRESKRELWWRLFSALLGVALMGWGLWYVTRSITLADIGRSLRMAQGGYIALATAVILLTLLLKAWRWQLLFYPAAQRPPLTAAFWAMMLGQFVNTAVTFMRLGDVARVVALGQQTGLSKMRALGTLAVEKTLDLLMLGLTLLILLPFVALPDFVAKQGVSMGATAVVACLILYLIAYQAPLVVRLLRAMARRLPPFLADRLTRWGIAGLEGLTALRSRSLTLLLLTSSAFLAFLAVVTPWALFLAFNLPYSLKEAALINVVLLAAGTIPVPTPARLGMVELAVMFMLRYFGLLNEALAFSYAITYHLIVDLPKLILGAVALPRTGWRFHL